MSKRKFQEISNANSTSGRLSSSQQRQRERLLGYLENGQTQLLGALKLARGFERQKLGRRQKDATSKLEQDGSGKDVERIDAEIKALKALDLNGAAEFYIERTLCRIKTIASSPAMPKELLQRGNAPSPYREPAVANVTARLFKSTAVRDTMDSIEKNVREIVTVHKQEPQHRQVEEEEEYEHKARGGNTTSRTVSSEGSDFEDEYDLIHTGNGEAASKAQHADSYESDNATDTDIGHDAYQDRLVSGSDSELESESESDIGEQDLSESDDASPRLKSDREAKVLKPIPHGPSPVRSKQATAKPTNSKIKPTTKTTFLPTLASGYISGSDSGSFASDAEETIKKSKPKNRMGQQARRALAEQRYGTAANHLKRQSSKQSRTRSARDRGWDLKKGATNGREKGGSFGRHSLKSNADPGANDETNTRKPKVRAKDDTGQLHPSWIAKKKLKEQQSQGLAVFKGKKMVFD